MRKLRLLTTASLAGILLVNAVLLVGLALRETRAAPRYEDLQLFSRVLSLVQEHYVNEVDERELIEGAIEGLLSKLDPHTSYLSRDLYQEIQRDTKGEFEGLGIEITKGTDYVTVVSPIDGTPAAAAGLRARDQIVAVCPEATEDSCKSTQDMNLLEAVKLMRGPRGTKIMIQVLREGWMTPKPFVIKRDAIKVSSVRQNEIEPGMPYVRISQFQERTSRDLRDALAVARSAGPIRGLVLDLRDNPGGLLEQAVNVADLFLRQGVIVTSEGRSNGSGMQWTAQAEGTEPDYPIVVLVNGGSASASEIVAGALQDHERAIVMGEETFGKGSVQTIIPLEDESGLRLTTALYYLPEGRSIQETRIKPDVVVEQFSEAQVEAIEEAGERKSFGEVDLEGHLASPEGEDPGEAAEGEEDETPLTRAERFTRQLQRDRQLARAVDLLKSWSIFSRLDLGGAGG